MSEASGDKKKWFPLESNPEVMNKYIKTLGLKESSPLQFCDVFGLDDELLAMVQDPAALLLVFPISDATEKENAEACAAVNQEALNALPQEAQPFFIKQTISNACGTIGILHALANNLDKLGPHIETGSFLANFFKAGASMSGEERAKLLCESEQLEQAQAEAAQDGQTQNQGLDADINLHFVAFVHKDGTLYEMDGRKPFALARGDCTPETVLQAAAVVVKKYIAISQSQNFGITALAAPPQW